MTFEFTKVEMLITPNNFHAINLYVFLLPPTEQRLQKKCHKQFLLQIYYLNKQIFILHIADNNDIILQLSSILFLPSFTGNLVEAGIGLQLNYHA